MRPHSHTVNAQKEIAVMIYVLQEPDADKRIQHFVIFNDPLYRVARISSKIAEQLPGPI